MDGPALKSLLEQLVAGGLSIEEAALRLERGTTTNIEFARVDHHRQTRQGMPEVVLGDRKTAAQISAIISTLLRLDQNVLVTRIEEEKARAVLSDHPELTYCPTSRTLRLLLRQPRPCFDRPVAVVTAGTSDIPVAQEAVVTFEMCGVEVEQFHDVGVSGIHRLYEVLPVLRSAPAIVCIAGMEGALPSVLGGLVSVPVIAVPTSVGYGAALNGFTALFGMLTGCASGVTVVNIDNGFGAAMAVLRMARSRSVAP